MGEPVEVDATMRGQLVPVYQYPPRGMGRKEAARYIGVGVTLFDQMVADGRMPQPRLVNTRKIWDRYGLDSAFTDLPEREPPERAPFALL